MALRYPRSGTSVGAGTAGAAAPDSGGSGDGGCCMPVDVGAAGAACWRAAPAWDTPVPGEAATSSRRAITSSLVTLPPGPLGATYRAQPRSAALSETRHLPRLTAPQLLPHCSRPLPPLCSLPPSPLSGTINRERGAGSPPPSPPSCRPTFPPPVLTPPPTSLPRRDPLHISPPHTWVKSMPCSRASRLTAGLVSTARPSPPPLASLHAQRCRLGQCVGSAAGSGSVWGAAPAAAWTAPPRAPL